MTSPINHRIVNDKVTIFEHPSGLKAVASIYSTLLGPALSPLGIQQVTEDQAIAIATKKGQALTNKCALHQIENGGGCLLVIGDPSKPKPEAFYELAAYVCDYYEGRMIGGQDVGVSDSDIAKLADLVKDPKTVAYHPGAENHSITTARGVRLGIEATFNYASKGKNIDEAHVLVQGLGNVGKPLVQELSGITKHVFYTNCDGAAGLDEGKFIQPDAAYDFKADVLSPCVSGAGLITKEVVDQLKVAVIAGSSNLQFADDAAIWAAHNKGILHAPDPVINGGGIIAITQDTPEKIKTKLDLIPKTLVEIFDRSKKDNKPPMIIAQEIAGEILAAAEAKQQKPKL